LVQKVVEKRGKRGDRRERKSEERKSFEIEYERNPRGEEIVCFSFPLFVII
jgi:hypothetical protein